MLPTNTEKKEPTERKESEDPEIEHWNYTDDEDDDETLTCWCCHSCGKVVNNRPSFGGQCPRCGCVMEEDIL